MEIRRVHCFLRARYRDLATTSYPLGFGVSSERPTAHGWVVGWLVAWLASLLCTLASKEMPNLI